MPPRKRLLLSAYCEAVAKRVAKCEAVPADELKNAVAEATSHLASPLHLRHTDEFRMCLALLAAATETAAAPPPPPPLCRAVTDSSDESSTASPADGASDDASDEDAATTPSTPPPAPPPPPQPVLEVLHAASSKAVADQCGAILKGAFGEHYGDELDGVLNGDACANQENDRTFVVAWRAGDIVHAAGVVAERRVFQGKAAPRKVVWEVLWLCAPSERRGRGHGSRAWAALAALAAARRVEGVLVPSTDAALLFWLGCASDKCPLSSVVLREDSSGDWVARSSQFQKRGTVDRVRRAFDGLEARARPGKGLAGLYEATAVQAPTPTGGRLRRRRSKPSLVAAAAAFEGRPFRWDPSEATHVWFFPGVAMPPVSVVKAVVVRDARPRAASFIREDDDSRRPRASSACGVRGFEAEGG